MSEILNNLKNKYKQKKKESTSKEEKQQVKHDYKEMKELTKGADKLLKKHDEELKKMNAKWDKFDFPSFDEYKENNQNIEDDETLKEINEKIETSKQQYEEQKKHSDAVMQKADETIKQIDEKLAELEKDKSLEKTKQVSGLLTRTSLSELYGYHLKNNISDEKSTLDYLNRIHSIISNYEFVSDENFVLLGRKKFIYDEIKEILNGTKEVNNPLSFVLGSLEEFICNNNFVYMHDSENWEKGWEDLRNRNDIYSRKNIISLEERNIIEDIINKIKNYISNKLTNVNNNMEVSKMNESNIETKNYIEEIDKKNAIFISDLMNKDCFMIDWHEGAVIPKTHPRYYDGRIEVNIKKAFNSSYGNINFGKDEYKVTDEMVNNLYNYIEINIDKLIKIALNQSTKMYEGASDSLNIKFKSIYISISGINASSEEEKNEIYKIKEEIKNLICINKIKNNDSNDNTISDEQIKKTINEIAEPSDIDKNNLLFELIKYIINIPLNSEITIAQLMNLDNNSVAMIDPLTQGKIFNLLMRVCEKLNIKIEVNYDEIGGLAYFVKFRKVENA